MGPHGTAFMPKDEVWRIQSDMSRIQQIQHEHADRINRLERRHDDDTRTRSIWSSTASFPTLLAATPQQRAAEQLPHIPNDAFTGFDSQSNNLLGSLHLDPEHEPHRLGPVSRANSVRFDESAKPAHWSHANRSSLDLIQKTASGLASYSMGERTFSHKSDGRQSSAGYSVHSIHSLPSRANDNASDTLYGLGSSDAPAVAGVPSLNPGLILLGACPAIIRCWLTTKFSHDSLLYAAVCSGSYASCISMSLVDRLGLTSQAESYAEPHKVSLKVYFPEAVVRSLSSRSASPALPPPSSITVEFVILPCTTEAGAKPISVILGSDALRNHSADILFSTNSVILFDDEHSKLSIPLVRPEDDKSFKTLQTVAGLPTTSSKLESMLPESGLAMSQVVHPSGQISGQLLGLTNHIDIRHEDRPSSHVSMNSIGFGRPNPSLPDPSIGKSNDESTDDAYITSKPSFPPPAPPATPAPPAPPAPSPALTTDPSAIWNKWRRDMEKPGSHQDGLSDKSHNYHRREQGTKILRPVKLASPSRTASADFSISSPSGTQSRFFEHGKRRTTLDDNRRTISNGSDASATRKVSMPTAIKDGSSAVKPPKSINPVGSGSAFSWLAK